MKERNNLEKEYVDLFPNYEAFEEVQEWKKDGDVIHEFTMFEDYPPSYSTCHTIISE